ncbi:MAG TPA: methionine adenosyltransferase [Nitrospira sp.]|nr:methionine adenosyltransferase [Nitrospira sp.]
MTEPIVQPSGQVPVAERPIEIVERKGLGHPDTICDAVMEQVAVDLAQAYLRTCGRVLHFNADKALLVAGQAACRFGGGAVLSPMRLVMGDRATYEWKSKRIPVGDIAERAVYRWFRLHLPLVKPIKDLVCQVELKPSSAELRSTVEGAREPVANDTSAVVGYAPLTPTERLVLDTEQFLNSPSFKREWPDTGRDVKVLALRQGTGIELTVAMPFLAGKIRRESEYFSRKAQLIRSLQQFVRQRVGRDFSVRLDVNTLDRRGQGIDGVYLTLLGTSAESGDSGEVGRGNRVCGVSSLYRPASSEAAAGKNPIAHVGKIYSVLAQVMAEELHQKIKGLQEVTVRMTSRIGEPVSQPHTIIVEAGLRDRMPWSSVEGPITRQVQGMLRAMPSFCHALARGVYAVC